LSKAEFDRLPRYRQWLERHYRSMIGLTTYYLVEYWWKHLLFLTRAERREMKRPWTYCFDALLVTIFLVLEVVFVLTYSAAQPPAASYWASLASPAALLMMVLVIPFLIWNWLMSVASFLHHNHPRAAWFIDRAEWDFFAGQVESVTHVTLPWFLEWSSA